MTDGRQTHSKYSVTLQPTLSEVARGRRFLADIAEEAGFPDERVFDITVACSEAMANAIEHSPVKGAVQVHATLYDDRLEVEIEGPGEFQAPDRLKDRNSRGLGLPLMAKLSDHLALFSGPQGQTLVNLTFYRPHAARGDAGPLSPSFANLAEENQLLDDVLRHLPDGFYVLDHHGRFVYVNPAALPSPDVPAEDLIGSLIWDTFPDIPPAVRRSLQAASTERSVARVVAFTESGRWREWTVFPVDEGVAVHSRDITDVKNAEEALRESEERYRGLIEQAADGIFLADAGGRYTESNTAGLEMLGYSLEELRRLSVTDVIVPEEVPRMPGQMSTLATGNTATNEWVFRRKDGSTFIGEVVGRQLPDGRLLGILRDITERKSVEEDRERLLAEEKSLTEELTSTNEELAATNEELRCQTEELLEREMQLRASRRRLELMAGIVDRASQPIAVGFLDGGLGELNQAFAELVGYPRQELVRLDWSTRLTPPEWREFEAGRLAELENGRGHVTYEKEYVHKDGTRIPVELLVHLARDPEGKPLYYFAFVTDLRERRRAQAERDKMFEDEQALNEELSATNEEIIAQTEELVRTEEALRLSEERFRLALENAPVSLAAMDRELRYVWAHNQRTAAPDEVVGKTLEDLFPAEAERLLDIHRRALNGGGRVHEGVWITRPQGRLFLDLHIEPRLDAHGDVEGLWVASVDLTAQKQAEESLQFQAELLANVQDPMTGTDENLVVTYWNEAAERVFGWKAEEVMGRPAVDILRTELQGISREEAVTALRATGRFRGDITYLRKDGERVHVDVSTAVLRRPDGTMKGTISVQRDMTERRKMEEALRSSDERTKILLRVADAVAEWTDLDRVLEASLEAVLEVTAHKRASIGLLDPGRRHIRVFASAGVEAMKPASAPLMAYSQALQDAVGNGKGVLVDYDRLPPEQRQVADVYRTRHALIAPLVHQEQVTGVILVDDPGEWMPFTPEEEELITGIAAQVATAIENARLYEAQKNIAEQLQQTILDLPSRVSSLEFSHLYRSATEEAIVGGDFYDVFERPDGSVILLAGDVSGHGVNSARVATMVKASLAAFSQNGEPPAAILENTNRLLMRKRVPGFTSVLFASYQPSSGLLEYCSAGHPNLMLGHADGAVEIIGRNHAPLGIFPDWTCTVDAVPVHSGDTLLLYTDGLTEARIDGACFGEQRLSDTLSRLTGLELRHLPQALLDEALAFSDGRLQDDVAILAVRPIAAQSA